MWYVPLFSVCTAYSRHATQGGGGPGTLWQTVLPFLIVSPVIIGVSWLVMIFFVRELYHEFG